MLQVMLFSFVLISFLFSAPKKNSTVEWNEIQPGLAFAEVPMTQKSSHGDSKVRLLKIDPSVFEFELACASQTGLKTKPIDVWGKEKGWIAAINAGMFHGYPVLADYAGITNSGYMKNWKHVNNPAFSSDKAFMVFQPKHKQLPDFQIIDKTCQQVNSLLPKYNVVIQGIRMLDCKGKPIWKKDNKKWSICVLATDTAGMVYMIHCRSPYTVASFLDQITLILPTLNRAIYLEGGPESSLWIQTKTYQNAWMGSYETGFVENDENHRLWDLANVVGIRPVKK